MGVSRGAVAQWEMEKGTAPSVVNLSQLAVRTGVAFEWLATGRGAMTIETLRVSEDAPAYADENSAIDSDEQLLLRRFRASSAERKRAILVLLKQGRD